MDEHDPTIAAQPHNLAMLLHDVVRSYGEFPALASEEEIVSYRAFFDGVLSVAAAMRRHGITRASLVALNTGSTRVSLTVLFATALIGCRFVIASKTLAASAVERPTHFLKSMDAEGRRKVDFIDIDESWMPQGEIDVAAELARYDGHATPDDDWMLLHTSGSTGRPKYFALTPRMVSLRSLAVAREFPVGETTIAMIFQPTSRPFFARALAAMIHAGCIVETLEPAYWKEIGVTAVYASPRQASEYLETAQWAARLPRLELSGAHVSDTVAARMLDLFDEVIDVYGASETSKSYETVLTRADDGRIVRRGRKLDSEIRITRPDGTPCAPLEMGEVAVRNPYLIDGYLPAPDPPRHPIRDGWYVPGDIGYWSEEGDFRIVGRADDVISIGGVKLDATMIDLVIQSTPGVQAAISFENPRSDRPNEIAAFVVFAPEVDRNATIAAIREAYAETLNLPCFLGRIHGVDDIPRDPEGAPSRAVCKKMLLDRVAELGEAYSE